MFRKNEGGGSFDIAIAGRKDERITYSAAPMIKGEPHETCLASFTQSRVDSLNLQQVSRSPMTAAVKAFISELAT